MDSYVFTQHGSNNVQIISGMTPDEITASLAELAALKADMEAGRLVRVVRCKDCKNGVSIKGVRNIACEDSDGYCDPDDYCMYGELRDAPVGEQEGQDG